MARDRKEIVKELLASIGKFDEAGMAACLSEDAVMSFPYVDQIAEIEGRDAIIAQILGTVPKMLKAMHFDFQTWYECADPDTLIVEYTSKCPLQGRDGFYENSYISIFRFRGDEITFYKEYMNPLKMAATYSEDDLSPA